MKQSVLLVLTLISAPLALAREPDQTLVYRLEIRQRPAPQPVAAPADECADPKEIAKTVETAAPEIFTLELNISNPIDDSPFKIYTYTKYQDVAGRNGKTRKKIVSSESRTVWINEHEANIDYRENCPAMPEIIGFDRTKSEVIKSYSVQISRKKQQALKSDRLCYKFSSQDDSFVESAYSPEVPFGNVHTITTTAKQVVDLELIEMY